MSQDRRSYTIEEANALIPQVRAVLLQLAVEQRRLDASHAEMHRQLDANGDPASAAAAVRQEAEVAEIREGMRTLLVHLGEMGVELRDVEMGLVDFPGRARRRAGLALLAAGRSARRLLARHRRGLRQSEAVVMPRR